MLNQALALVFIAQAAIKTEAKILARLRLLQRPQRAPVRRIPLHTPIGAAAQYDSGGRARALKVSFCMNW